MTNFTDPVVPDIAVATNPLNYADVKKKALASKQLKSITHPQNGQTFPCGSTINFSTSAQNSPGLYLDSSMSYLRFRINNESGDPLTLDQTAYSLFNRVLITSAGQTFQDTQNYNLLHNILYSLSAGSDYVNNTGRLLMGGHANNSNNATYEGATIPANGGSLVVSLPLALSPLVNTTPYRYIYIGGSRAPFDFKITLEQAAVSFVSGGAAAPANNQVKITDFEFHAFHVQLNEMAQSMVSAMTGGAYNMLTTEYINFQTTVQGGAQGVNFLSFPVGISRSSVDRIIVCHRPQVSVNGYDRFSLSNRAKANMDHIKFVVSGQSIPSRRIEVGNNGGNSNAIAEYLIANHNLDDVTNLSNIFYSGNIDNFGLNNGAGNATNNVGSFIVGINTDSLAHNSDKAFSGVNCIGQTCFLEVGYSAPVPANMVLDLFAQNTVLMSMNERESGVYGISV